MSIVTIGLLYLSFEDTKGAKLLNELLGEQRLHNHLAAKPYLLGVTLLFVARPCPECILSLFSDKLVPKKVEYREPTHISEEEDESDGSSSQNEDSDRGVK